VMSNGGIRFKSWELLEISLVVIPANPQALIESLKGVDPDELPAPQEKRRLPSEPLPVVIFDVEKAKHSELTRLGDRVRQIDQLLRDNNRQRQKYQYDQLRLGVLWDSKRALEEEKVGLLRRSIAIETGTLDVSQEQQTKAAAAVTRQEAPVWELKNLPEPSLAGLDVNQVLATHPSLIDHFMDVVAKTMSEIGISPATRVSHQEMAVSDASMMSCIVQMRAIATMLDKRIGALESGIVAGVKFMGTWQRQQKYPAGSLATFKGALWHCNRDSEGIEPGDGSPNWTLCAKGGDVPLPQRDTAGRRIAGDEPRKPVKVEVTEVTRHDSAGRILETRKRTVEE
jgi:hypothetical protein